MLHPRGQGHHGQVVGVGDGVDVAGEPDGEGRQRDALGQAAAGRRALDVEGRAAAGLADRADHASCRACPGPATRPMVVVVLPSPSGVGVMAVTSMYLAVGAVLQTRPGRCWKSTLASLPAHRDQLVVRAGPARAASCCDRLHVLLGRLGDLPVLHLARIQSASVLPCASP